MAALGPAERLSLRSRRRKLDLFLRLLRPGPETTVVDVGVEDGGFGEGGFRTQNFFEELYPWPERVTAVGVHEGRRFRERYPRIAYVQADGCALPFADGQFDCYFSNAVLEHVGDRERQRLFVAEALRVARAVFLTTPNRRFPVEVHTRLPLVHWLPDRPAHRLYELAGKPWAKEIHLLGPREFAALFPAGARVRIVESPLALVAVSHAQHM